MVDQLSQLQKDKLDAAYRLLTEPTTSLEKFEKTRTLLLGISPTLDKILSQASSALKRVRGLGQGDLIGLAIESATETTAEEKKRKKAILLFLSYWKTLHSEVARIQAVYASTPANQPVEKAAKIAYRSKGPFGLITSAAVVVVAVGGLLSWLKLTSVSVDIKNQGCPPIAIPKLPISLPGIKLPASAIGTNSEATATLPPLKVNVDSQNGTYSVSTYGLHTTYNSTSNFIFDGSSLKNTHTLIDLGSSKSHELIVSCK